MLNFVESEVILWKRRKLVIYEAGSPESFLLVKKDRTPELQGAGLWSRSEDLGLTTGGFYCEVYLRLGSPSSDFRVLSVLAKWPRRLGADLRFLKWLWRFPLWVKWGEFLMVLMLSMSSCRTTGGLIQSRPTWLGLSWQQCQRPIMRTALGSMKICID